MALSGAYASASTALRVTGAHKSPLHNKAIVPVEGFSKLLVFIGCLVKALAGLCGAIWLETFEGTCQAFAATYVIVIQSCRQEYICVHLTSQVKYFHERTAEIMFPWRTEVVLVFHVPRMLSELVIL
jgi:hypothetical protein